MNPFVRKTLCTTSLILSMSVSAHAGSSNWSFSSSKDEFTDVETVTAMSLSPYNRSSYGDTIALFVSCKDSIQLYAGVIWEEVVSSLPMQPSALVNYRVGNEEPQVGLAEIVGKKQESTYFYDVEAIYIIHALQKASDEGAEVLFGVETLSSSRRLARFSMEGFNVAAANVLKSCNYEFPR